MTRERLIEAIQAHDPDGKGVDRVIHSARTNSIKPGSCGECLLAVAWSSDASIHVAFDNFYLRGDSYPHKFSDVVTWYDQAPRSRANQRVLAILEVTTDD